jgi:hypothetical protein
LALAVNLTVISFFRKAQFPKGFGLFVFLGIFLFCFSNPAEGQFWKNWFKKKPEERGVLGGKDKLEERIKSRTLDDGEDAKPLIFGDSAASDKRVVRKKKPKKRMFYGAMTKKGFIKKQTGRKQSYEFFYYLKKGTEIQPFVKDIYWYHKLKRKIMVGNIPPKDKPFAKILHGPYKKVTEGKVEEEGIFYFGAKHGRWMYEKAQGEEMMLVEKEKFYKGHPKESNFSYFDTEKTKIKEVVPFKNGDKHGEYCRFSETGNLLSEGKYEFNIKVGKWTDYFDNNKRKIKRQIQYAKNWEEKNFKPYTLILNDEKGKVIYDKAAEDKKKPAERKPDPTTEF